MHRLYLERRIIFNFTESASDQGTQSSAITPKYMLFERKALEFRLNVERASHNVIKPAH